MRPWLTMAEIFSTKAIILRIKQLQTADKLYICYSQELGKIAVVAYGIGRGKSRYNGLMQPFSNLELQLASGKRYDTFRQAEILGLRLPDTDFEFLTYASILTELVEQLTPDKQPEPAIYDLLAQCLQLITVRNKRLVVIIFIVKLLDIIGLGPNYHDCIICEQHIDAAAHYSDLKGGMICSNCRVSEDIELDLDTQTLLEIFIKLDLSTKIEFSINGKQLKQLENLMYRLIYQHIDKPLKSLQFLAKL